MSELHCKFEEGRTKTGRYRGRTEILTRTDTHTDIHSSDFTIYMHCIAQTIMSVKQQTAFCGESNERRWCEARLVNTIWRSTAWRWQQVDILPRRVRQTFRISLDSLYNKYYCRQAYVLTDDVAISVTWLHYFMRVSLMQTKSEASAPIRGRWNLRQRKNGERKINRCIFRHTFYTVFIHETPLFLL